MARVLGAFLPELLGFRPTGDLGPLTIYTNKRGLIVAYPKAPPDKPPTYFQIRQRNRFRLCGQMWSRLPPASRNEWNRAAEKCGAAICGYTLFVWYQLIHDNQALQTISRQVFVKLPPDP